jgi:hypothetical protein
MDNQYLLEEAERIIRKFYNWNQSYREGQVPSYDAELLFDDLVAHAATYLDLLNDQRPKVNQ